MCKILHKPKDVFHRCNELRLIIMPLNELTKGAGLPLLLSDSTPNVLSNPHTHTASYPRISLCLARPCS